MHFVNQIKMLHKIDKLDKNITNITNITAHTRIQSQVVHFQILPNGKLPALIVKYITDYVYFFDELPKLAKFQLVWH